MFHGGELFIAGPGDSQQEGGVFDGFYVVPDGGGEGEEVADAEIVWVVLSADADVAFEYLDGDGAVSVVLLHSGGLFHGDEDDSEVVLFEEGFGVMAGGPWLFLLGVGDLLVEIKLRLFIDHGAVLLGGCHLLLLLR